MSLDWMTPKWEPTPNYGKGWIVALWRGSCIQEFARPQYRFYSLTEADSYCAHLNAGGKHADTLSGLAALIAAKDTP